MYDQYTLAAGFNAGNSAMDVYRALQPFSNGESSTPLCTEDLKFVVYPPTQDNTCDPEDNHTCSLISRLF
jgi:hypothetical protein